LYPPTFSGEPSLKADEWFGGKTADPKQTSLAPGFVPAKNQDTSFKTVAVDEPKKLSEKELRDENEKLKKKVAHLETELAKRDARLKELESNKK
jgi:coronin-1B/1C/6